MITEEHAANIKALTDLLQNEMIGSLYDDSQRGFLEDEFSSEQCEAFSALHHFDTVCEVDHFGKKSRGDAAMIEFLYGNPDVEIRVRTDAVTSDETGRTIHDSIRIMIADRQVMTIKTKNGENPSIDTPFSEEIAKKCLDRVLNLPAPCLNAINEMTSQIKAENEAAKKARDEAYCADHSDTVLEALNKL